MTGSGGAVLRREARCSQGVNAVQFYTSPLLPPPRQARLPPSTRSTSCCTSAHHASPSPHSRSRHPVRLGRPTCEAVLRHTRLLCTGARPSGRSIAGRSCEHTRRRGRRAGGRTREPLARARREGAAEEGFRPRLTLIRRPPAGGKITPFPSIRTCVAKTKSCFVCQARLAPDPPSARQARSSACTTT